MIFLFLGRPLEYYGQIYLNYHKAFKGFIISIHRIQMPEKSVHLKAVGGKGEVREKKQVDFSLNREEGEFREEEVPGEEEYTRTNTRAKTERTRFRGQYLLNEDPRKSRFSHSKLMAIEKISCLLATLIFFLSCSKTEMDIIQYDPDQLSSRAVMYALSVCTGSLIFVIMLRYVCQFELQFDQNKVYLKKGPRQWWITAFFLKSEKVKYFLLEVLIILPHPISFLQGQHFQLFQTYDEVYLNHSFNDLMALLLVGKIYIVLRALINLSTYSSPRASRLCHQNGFEHSLLYVVKCILNEKPLVAIAINFVGLLMVLGYALKISEGVLFLYNPGLVTGFQTYENCFWCIFITMSTVGYGDNFPKTLLGRFIILATAISGVLLSSLLIVSLSLYLDMLPSESKSHITLTRLGEQKHLAAEAAKALTETIQVQQLVSRPEGYDQAQLRSKFEKLKKSIDSSKARTRKIKSLVDTDNIIEEMNRLFYILKDNLKDIFIGQLKLREEISKIEEIQSIKLSFIREVEEMLSKASASRTSTVDPTPNPN